MAEYFIAKNNIPKALVFGKKAMQYAEKSNDAEILMEAQVTQGKLLFRQKQFEKAINVLQQASTHAYEFDKTSYIIINQLLSESHAQSGNWKEAFVYQNIYTKANEAMLNESAKQTIANAEAQFQNRTKQEKINLLSAENKVKNLQIENTRKTQIYLGIGFVLLLTIAGLLYMQNINRKRTNRKLQVLNSELDQANKTKARFFSIINHDLRGPIANLIHFLYLQENHPELLDEESEKRLKQKTTTGAENLLSSMEDLLLWSKSQMDNFEPQPQNITIDSLFSDTAKHFSNTENISIIYNNPEKIELFTDDNYLKTIIRNLTGNAIKALEKTLNPAIEWKAYTKNNKTILSISDNGPGGTNEQFKALYDETTITGISSGLGLHLIRDLAKIINAEITVVTHPESGTTITISL
jgi:signal transduction histidine kinase